MVNKRYKAHGIHSFNSYLLNTSPCHPLFSDRYTRVNKADNTIPLMELAFYPGKNYNKDIKIRCPATISAIMKLQKFTE